jgi:transcriptional regulator with XRE-family HTH domain
MPSDAKKNITERLKMVRLDFGLSQRDFALKIGVPVRTLVRWEGGQTAPSGVKLRQVERFLEGLAGNAISEPAPPPPGPDHGPSAARLRGWGLEAGQDAPPHMQELELLLLEFNAWSRRTALKQPQIMERLPRLVRRVINEIEDGEGEKEKPKDERQLAS